MKRFLFTILFLLLAAPALAQSPGYYVRADCAEITDPVANQTFCLQSTTVSGRTAGHAYVYNGSTWVDVSSSSSGGHVIKDDGTARAQRTNLNFVGGSVTCVDDSPNDETECTIDVPAGDAPGDATYITQIANGSLSAEFALGSLSTGCLGVTTATGALAARTLTGGSQIAIANGNCSGTPTFSIVANSLGPTQIDETANYTWVGVHTFSSATVVGVPASSIVFTPNGSIAATTVQAAIQEVRDEAGSATGDLTEVTATLPLTVASGTGPIPDVRCTTCETTTGSQAKVDTHVNDTSAAHAASSISADSTTLVGTGTNVQSVFEELDNAIVAAEVATAAHLADSTAAHAASAISVDSTTLVGTGTTVQAVFEELDDALADHLASLDTFGTVTARGRTDYGANSVANGLRVGKDANDHWVRGHDPTDGLFDLGVCGGVLNGCNYLRGVDSGFVAGFKTGGVTKFEYTAATGVTKATKAGALVDVTQIVQIVQFGTLDAAVNDTDYLRTNGFTSVPVDTNSAEGRWMAGFDGSVTELYCHIDDAPTSTHTITFTVTKATNTDPNGAFSDSTMVAVITSTAMVGSTTTNPVSFVKGNYLGIKKVDSASAVASNLTLCFLRVEG